MMSDLKVWNKIIVSRKYCLLMYYATCRGVGSGPLRVHLTISLPSVLAPTSGSDDESIASRAREERKYTRREKWNRQISRAMRCCAESLTSGGGKNQRQLDKYLFLYRYVVKIPSWRSG